jgi:hypothetical protein
MCVNSKTKYNQTDGYIQGLYSDSTNKMHLGINYHALSGTAKITCKNILSTLYPDYD